MTAASLAAAIRKLAPETPIHLAIAIAVNALGYGRAYGVPAEMVVAVAMHPSPPRVVDRIDHLPDAIRDIAKAEAARTVNGKSTRGSTIRGRADLILAAAEAYKGPKYGAEG